MPNSDSSVVRSFCAPTDSPRTSASGRGFITGASAESEETTARMAGTIVAAGAFERTTTVAERRRGDCAHGT